MPRFTSLLTSCEEYRLASLIAYGIIYEEALRVGAKNLEASDVGKVYYLLVPNLVRRTVLEVARQKIGFTPQTEVETVVKMACEAVFPRACRDAKKFLERQGQCNPD